MFTRWETYAALAFAVGGVALGVAFRRGRARGMARWYTRRDLPFYVRNIAFGMIPYALVFGSWFALFALAHAGLDVAAAIVGYGSFVFFAIGLWWTIRPPEFLKPDWMRANEP